MTRAMLIHGAMLLKVAITVQSDDILPARTHPHHYLQIMLTRLEIRILLNPSLDCTTVLHLLQI